MCYNQENNKIEMNQLFFCTGACTIKRGSAGQGGHLGTNGGGHGANGWLTWGERARERRQHMRREEGLRLRAGWADTEKDWEVAHEHGAEDEFPNSVKVASNGAPFCLSLGACFKVSKEWNDRRLEGGGGVWVCGIDGPHCRVAIPIKPWDDERPCTSILYHGIHTWVGSKQQQEARFETRQAVYLSVQGRHIENRKGKARRGEGRREAACSG